MEQKSCLRLIYKLESTQLKRAKWNLNLPLDEAITNQPRSVVSLADSQVMRFIDEINGVDNISEKVRVIQQKINIVKKKPKSRETKVVIRELYRSLYELQFQRDYICVIMNSKSDYDRANLGFTVNGISYRRFLGTNGGIKNSTIVYVSERIYPELKKRLDNGRNKEKVFVPAKLEAYQALICSGSIPIPEPKGIIVVDDCITHFKDDVIYITDEDDGEPKLSYIDGYDIEHDDSDGYGIMLPSYSCRVNEYLTGDTIPLSGMNTRYAWTKGMVYTFDFIEFAEKIAGTYEVIDVWGDKRDVRDAEVVLTASMLKLWDSYDSWEDYYNNCLENHYQFSTPKITPATLENVRTTNYQFLQSYEFTDEELLELCLPTIDEINDVLGMDYRKSLVFLAGYGLNENNIRYIKDDYVKALMIEPDMINDPYVRRNIYSMIKKRIECAKKGSIKVNANYAMISGDPYALAQSMFGLEITGILKAGEIYHKYWIDKGAKEIVCFRAPMTCHSNIRKMKLNYSDDAAKWFQYIKTALIYNAWDTACEAMNGADKDGDTNMCTDNPVLLRNTHNERTIICAQRKAAKVIPTEETIIEANKLAFNDDIGTITNYVTSMFDVQAGFEKGSNEYKELDYRIKCGQLMQQNSIDRAKGIIAKPMPEYWYSYRAIDKSDNRSELNEKIVAAYKPYFMIYVYPTLRSKYKKYIADSNRKARRLFKEHGVKTIDDLYTLPNKTDDMREFLSHYESDQKIGTNPCIVNRICWLFESAFPKFTLSNKCAEFDYSILKCGTEYSRDSYNQIAQVYLEYKKQLNSIRQRARLGLDDDTGEYTYDDFIRQFKMRCNKICPDECELCDIILDLCYHSDESKRFAWDVAGEIIIENLLQRHDGKITFPTRGGDEFEYCGETFSMTTVSLNGEKP